MIERSILLQIASRFRWLFGIGAAMSARGSRSVAIGAVRWLLTVGKRGAATSVQIIPLPSVLAEVADVFPRWEPANHGQRQEQLKIGMAAQDGCSKYYLLYCTLSYALAKIFL